MLAIKASREYMGNSAGEGAIWQRTPTGEEVKVRKVNQKRDVTRNVSTI